MHARNKSDTQFRSRQANRNIAARRSALCRADLGHARRPGALGIPLRRSRTAARSKSAIAPSAAATPYPSPMVRAV